MELNVFAQILQTIACLGNIIMELNVCISRTLAQRVLGGILQLLLVSQQVSALMVFIDLELIANLFLKDAFLPLLG